MNKPSHFSAKQNPSQATIMNGSNDQTNEDELEVELASAGQRISAALINILIVGIIVSPIIYVFLPFKHMSIEMGYEFLFLDTCIGIPLLLILAAWQISWMRTRGQSIGKRIMKIKVIGENGEDPNFWRVVLIREVAFYFISKFMMAFVTAIIWIIAHQIIGNNHSMTAKSVFIFFKILPICLPYLICLPMLFFPSHDRRTLQDYLAKTLVVKA